MTNININQIVHIINCDGFDGLTWTVIGFDGDLVSLQNTANHAHYMKAHPSNLA